MAAQFGRGRLFTCRPRDGAEYPAWSADGKILMGSEIIRIKIYYMSGEVQVVHKIIR
jgi:hypothetical protein